MDGKTLLTLVAFALSLVGAVAGGSITYANLASRRRDLVSHTLTGWSKPFEQFLSSMCPYGTGIWIDFQDYLSVDPAETVAYTKAGLDQGWLTLAEARTMHKLPPMADLMAPESQPEMQEQEQR